MEKGLDSLNVTLKVKEYLDAAESNPAIMDAIALLLSEEPESTVGSPAEGEPVDEGLILAAEMNEQPPKQETG